MRSQLRNVCRAANSFRRIPKARKALCRVLTRTRLSPASCRRARRHYAKYIGYDDKATIEKAVKAEKVQRACVTAKLLVAKRPVSSGNIRQAVVVPTGFEPVLPT
jgi:hypothetical protein